MAKQKTGTKPRVKLIGEDGNVFNVIARVSKALRNSDQPLREKEFQNAAFNAQSYDEVLQLAMRYCDVS